MASICTFSIGYQCIHRVYSRVTIIDVGQWLASGLQRPSTVRQSLAVRQKELSEEHRMTLKRQKCIENKQNLCNFPFFLISFSLISIFPSFFFIFSLFLLFFSIFLSPSVRQRWTVQQNGPSIEGPEGPPPTSMAVHMHLTKVCMQRWE